MMSVDVLREHGFHTVRVVDVVTETPDARTFVFDVSADLRDLFTYRAGQFCNVRVGIDGDEHVRCYSMSSAPSVDERLAVTVKRVPGGLVSNWLHDHVVPGTSIELSRPTGLFVEQADAEVPMVAFCGGSGVTPVFSLVKQLLASTGRSVRVLYANRDESSVIFRSAFDELAAAHPDRLELRHHLDASDGFVSDADIAAFLGPEPADVYVCGPQPFMDIVERGVAAAGHGPDRLHIERFTATEVPVATDPPASDVPERLTVVLKGKKHHLDYVAGDTVLDAARRGGLKPPYSCELGNCASCMALVRSGTTAMRVNNALSPAEVDEGWVLTCQAVPTDAHVVVEYEHL